MAAAVHLAPSSVCAGGPRMEIFWKEIEEVFEMASCANHRDALIRHDALHQLAKPFALSRSGFSPRACMWIHPK